jgi:hypothetical protein
MERYLSTGAATIVALMSLHRRCASGHSSIALQREIGRIHVYLSQHDQVVDVDISRYRRQRWLPSTKVSPCSPRG